VQLRWSLFAINEVLLTQLIEKKIFGSFVAIPAKRFSANLSRRQASVDIRMTLRILLLGVE
jgi:hypothetical protein